MNRPAIPTAGQKAGQICSQASAPRASPNLKRGSSVPFIPLPLFMLTGAAFQGARSAPLRFEPRRHLFRRQHFLHGGPSPDNRMVGP